MGFTAIYKENQKSIKLDVQDKYNISSWKMEICKLETYLHARFSLS